LKYRGRILVILAMVIAASAGGYWWFTRGNRGIGKDNPARLSRDQVEKRSALVKVDRIRGGTITTNINVYGKIVPAPGAIQNISVPYESRIRRIMVSTGQEVARGDLLLELEPSPNARLKFIQAENLYKSEKLRLKHVQRLFDLKLATNTQVLQVKQALEQARSNLQSLKDRGVGGNRNIHSDVGGLVKKVYMEEGSIPSAGAPLVEIITQNRLEARLGVEPENIPKIHPHQPVLLAGVNVSATATVTGKIREISHAVNASTRLVDVFVTFPENGKFLLGEFVSGEIALASAQGMIVPRTAVLSEEGRHVLFTVRKGRAVKQVVRIGLETENEIEVMGADLQPGAAVVVSGNYELSDGMVVRTKGAP